MNSLLNRKTLRLGSIISLYIFLLSGSICIMQKVTNKNKIPLNLNKMIANEVKAFEYLKIIYEAQKKYYQVDWNGDGIKSYAKFVTHLWQTVDKNAFPVKSRFISKKLAFAVGDTKTIDGYYFLNIYLKDKQKSDSETEIENKPVKTKKNIMDYNKEWAVSATPGDRGVSGILSFIVTSEGRIFAKDNNRQVIIFIPGSLIPEGWTEIKGEDDIVKLHSKSGM